MANLSETVQWEANVPSIAETDAAEGATSGNPNFGIVNQPALKLANRTKYLKAVVDSIGVPVFVVNGKVYFNWINSAKKMYSQKDLYNADPSVQSVNANCQTFQGDSVNYNPGFLILEQAFRMPYNFTKLTLTFLAKSNIDLGVSRGVETFIIPNDATADSPNFTLSNYNQVMGPTLAANPIIRTVIFDLSAYPAGTPLTLLQSLSLSGIGSVVGWTSDFNVDCGQLRSSWGN